MEFLGFILDSLAFTIAITPEKRQELANFIEGVLQKPNKKITIRFLAKIIGRMVSFFPASDKAKLHYRTLERFESKMIHYHKSWKTLTRLDKNCLEELKWWQTYLKHDIVKSLRVRKITQILYTDASSAGFGGSWNGEEIQGLFTKKTKITLYQFKGTFGNLLHINYVCSMPEK